jgi:predicted O-methyltransferase YrrM
LNINGIPYVGSGCPEGVDEEVYLRVPFPLSNPNKKPVRSQADEVKNMGKVGGMCIGKSLMNGLSSQMNNPKFQRYLEVGTFDGVALSKMAKDNPTKEFHAVDAFINTRTTGGGCLKYFIQNNRGTFQLIFIDGEHSYENVIFDFEHCWSILDSQGILAFHDRPLEGVNKAWKEFSKKYGINFHKGAACGEHVVKL